MVSVQPERIDSPDPVQAGAAAAVASGKDVLGSILFCLAMNHKQMAMFYAPAFFAHLLGRCLQKPSLSSKVCYVMLSDSTLLICSTDSQHQTGRQRVQV